MLALRTLRTLRCVALLAVGGGNGALRVWKKSED